jgi:CRISPR-associated protein Cmr1
MDRLVVSLRVVTPMFLGGASPAGTAELRAPSIKGALRCWYRALDRDFRENEAKIFGGTGKNEGQSCFILRVTDLKIKTGKARDEKWHGKKTAYLGYGPINRDKTGKTYTDKHGQEKEEQKSMTLRPYIASGSTFSLSLLFTPRTDTKYKEWVKKSLWAMVMMGGLGSRSRKGFGSVVADGPAAGMDGLPSLTPKDSNELVSVIETFLKGIYRPLGLAEHTSWSQDARCVVADGGKTGEDALEWLGGEMHAYRSWKGEKNFKPDHDAMRDFIGSGVKPSAPPLRTAFGLPHNYFYTSLGNKKGGVDHMDGNKPGRRASPLLLRVHEFKKPTDHQPNGACVVATFLPARLIPAGATVRVSGQGQADLPLALPDDFSAVAGFVDRLAGKGKEVKP